MFLGLNYPEAIPDNPSDVIIAFLVIVFAIRGSGETVSSIVVGIARP